jgi:hypothetical protein
VPTDGITLLPVPNDEDLPYKIAFFWADNTTAQQAAARYGLAGWPNCPGNCSDGTCLLTLPTITDAGCCYAGVVNATAVCACLHVPHTR